MRGRTRWRVVLAFVLVLSACQTDQRQSAALPRGPQVVEVELGEYRFDYGPTIGGGRVLFRVRNTGRLAHSLTLLPLTDDIPPIDQQLRGNQRRAITPFAGIGPRKPGAASTFAVDLVPGARYALVCFLTDDQGTPHALRGMSSEFRAGRTGPEASPR